MAQQKSEDRDKPQGRRKPVVTRELETRSGGEAIPIDEVPKQLLLFAGTADALAQASGRGEADRSLERPATLAAPKPEARGKTTTAATMDEVVQRLAQAFRKVERNRGAPGPDGATLVLMREHLAEWLPLLGAALLVPEQALPSGGFGRKSSKRPRFLRSSVKYEVTDRRTKERFE